MMAFIALGSNLGNSSAILRQAMARLAALSDQPLLRSSLWQSDPIDCPPGSPAFINAVVGLVPRLGTTPQELLAQLQALEREFGRQPKKVLNEPRPLDLDLIDFAGTICSTPVLTLPHPRAHLRLFVLEPLAEIAPELRLAGCRQTVRQLRASLAPSQQVRRLGAAD